MFSMPNKGDGVFVVAVDQIHLGDDEYRMKGEELPDAFEWPESAIRGLVGVGKIVFVPKPPFDLELVRALAMRLSNRELGELLETRGLSVKGSKSDLVHRLLVDAKIERPTVEEMRAASPKPKLPRAYEDSRPTPPPPPKVAALEKIPEALHPQAVIMDRFAQMSEHELRTNVAPLYSVNASAGMSKDQILMAIAEVLAPELLTAMRLAASATPATPPAGVSVTVTEAEPPPANDPPLEPSLPPEDPAKSETPV